MFNSEGFEELKIYLLTKHISRLVLDFSVQQPSVSAKQRACSNNKQSPSSNTETNSLKRSEKSDENMDQTWNGKIGVRIYTVRSSSHKNTLYTAREELFHSHTEVVSQS